MSYFQKSFNLRYEHRPAVVEWLEENHFIAREHITGYADGTIGVLLWGPDESDIIAFKLVFGDRMIIRGD